MSSRAWASRVVEAVAHSPVTALAARVQETVYGPLIRRVARTPLHSGVLGHSLHPPLTDVTLGCFLGAGVLDLVGGPGARRSAALLLGAGVASSLPTALSGATDWLDLEGNESRIGAGHALAADVALFLFMGSLAARARGRHGRGVRLALAGHVVMAGAGFLGGHLALARGTARRQPVAPW